MIFFIMNSQSRRRTGNRKSDKKLETTIKSRNGNQEKNENKLKDSDNSSEEKFEKDTDTGDTDESSNQDSNEHYEKNQMQQEKHLEGTNIEAKDVGDESKSTDKSMFRNILMIVIICFVCICIIDKSSSIKQQKVETEIQKFVAELDVIKTSFPSQSQKLWKIVKITLESNLKSKENDYPAVLLLASTTKVVPTSHCIARKLSAAFSTACHRFVEVNGLNYQNQNPESVKKEIDTAITTAFEEKSCSVVMSRLESVPPYAATSFYKFCENDNAPFKNIAVIFTVQIEDGDWNKDNINLTAVPKNLWDQIVNDFLTETWKSKDRTGKMNDDMISGLLSRITPAVVWVNEESKLPSC